ncbi:metal-dependent hydrolase [Halorubellus litoreus]|uniref:Metal-dependent hydrolase n=1 Tax=Halorubellus litoreus TaxID=755308 RepID=A0ABD5VGR4_9EURY
MMGTTHALAGAFLGAAIAVVAPEFAAVVVVAAVAGSVAPDLDIYHGHRRTLHYPVYGWLVAAPAVALAMAVPSAWTVGAATFLAAAALHAGMDVFGGGLELRPWEAGSERAVYSHYHGAWLEPRRLVPYDGSPHDLGLAGAFAVVPATTLPEPVPAFVAAVLAVSVAYVALRKRLAALWATVARALPAPVAPYVPERFYD